MSTQRRSASYNPVPNNEDCEIAMDELSLENRFRRALSQVQNNNIEDPSLFTQEVVNYIDCKLRKPLLLLACEGKDDFSAVTDITVKFLLEKGANIYYVDKECYCWEALHYAAASANPAKLKVICNSLKLQVAKEVSQINSLTTLSENALHILFEHGLFSEEFNVCFQNGKELKSSKLIGKEQENIIDCVNILIEAGIDANHNNFWNETPILLAIKKKYFQVVKILLHYLLHCDNISIDLDSCKDPVSKKTVRQLLENKEDFVGLLPETTKSEDPKKLLFQFLKSGDEESFLNYNGGKLGDYVNSLDGYTEDNSSCTLLQYCFRRGLIACCHDMRKYHYEAQFHHSDITANHLVQVFCQNGMVKSIQHLLDNRAHISCIKGSFGNLLEAAAVKGYYPFIAMMLGRENIVCLTRRICEVILTLMEKSTTDIDLDSTLSVLLSRFQLPGQSISGEESTILMKALNLGINKINKENLRLFLKFPGSLCTQKIKNKTDVEVNKTCCRKCINRFLGLLCIQRDEEETLTSEEIEVNQTCCQKCMNRLRGSLCMQNNTKSILEEIDPEVIQAHLDECVSQENGDIYINYESFIKDSSTKEVERIFLQSKVLNKFLKHLAFKILVNRKWEKLRIAKNFKYFYLNLWFYIFYYALLIVYVLAKFNNESGFCITAIYYCNVFFLTIFSFKEIAQLIANPLVYLFKDRSNWAELSFIVIAIYLYSKPNDIVMVLAVLNSNLVLLLLLEQVPKLAKYILILRTVIFYLEYILFYFLQFVAFAICFYMLFSKPGENFWGALGNKIFETIVLYTGNLDYMDTNKFEKNELFSKLVFTLFVIFMAIILNNLLLGVLVTDMSMLNRSVELFKQMKRTSFVVKLQNFFVSKFAKCFCGCLMNYERWESGVFDEGYRIKVDKNDRKMLNDEEKQQLDFILVKKVQKQNVLKKLYNYIMTKMNQQGEEVPQGSNKEILEKLQLFEEMMKNFHDFSERMKNEIKNKKGD